MKNLGKGGLMGPLTLVFVILPVLSYIWMARLETEKAGDLKAEELVLGWNWLLIVTTYIHALVAVLYYQIGRARMLDLVRAIDNQSDIEILKTKAKRFGYSVSINGGLKDWRGCTVSDSAFQSRKILIKIITFVWIVFSYALLEKYGIHPDPEGIYVQDTFALMSFGAWTTHVLLFFGWGFASEI